MVGRLSDEHATRRPGPCSYPRRFHVKLRRHGDDALGTDVCVHRATCAAPVVPTVTQEFTRLGLGAGCRHRRAGLRPATRAVVRHSRPPRPPGPWAVLPLSPQARGSSAHRPDRGRRTPAAPPDRVGPSRVASREASANRTADGTDATTQRTEPVTTRRRRPRPKGKQGPDHGTALRELACRVSLRELAWCLSRRRARPPQPASRLARNAGAPALATAACVSPRRCRLTEVPPRAWR